MLMYLMLAWCCFHVMLIYFDVILMLSSCYFDAMLKLSCTLMLFWRYVDVFLHNSFMYFYVIFMLLWYNIYVVLMWCDSMFILFYVMLMLFSCYFICYFDDIVMLSWGYFDVMFTLCWCYVDVSFMYIYITLMLCWCFLSFSN